MPRAAAAPAPHCFNVCPEEVSRNRAGRGAGSGRIRLRTDAERAARPEADAETVGAADNGRRPRRSAQGDAGAGAAQRDAGGPEAGLRGAGAAVLSKADTDISHISLCFLMFVRYL